MNKCSITVIYCFLNVLSGSLYTVFIQLYAYCIFSFFFICMCFLYMIHYSSCALNGKYLYYCIFVTHLLNISLLSNKNHSTFDSVLNTLYSNKKMFSHSVAIMFIICCDLSITKSGYTLLFSLFVVENG